MAQPMETVVPSNDVVKQFIRIQDEQPTAEKVAEKSDAEIGGLAADPRWISFKTVIQNMVDQWEKEIEIKETDTPEQIGFKYMAGRLVAGALKAVRDLPDAVAEVQNGEPNTGE
jgi:hypothetical protein